MARYGTATQTFFWAQARSGKSAETPDFTNFVPGNILKITATVSKGEGSCNHCPRNCIQLDDRSKRLIG